MILKPSKGKLLNRSHWMSRGLVGCWLFNLHPQVLGQAFDYANGNHGTLVGDTHSVPGKFGNALDFDGTGDYVTCDGGDSVLDITTALTLGYWVKRSTGVHSNVGKFTSTADQKSYLLQTFTDNKIYCTVSNTGSDNIYFTSIGTVVDSNWHYIVGVYDALTLKVYLDGIEIAGNITGAVPSSLFNSNSAFDIGRYSEINYTVAQIDHVLIYNRALSAGEILSLYRNPFQMFEGSGL